MTKTRTLILALAILLLAGGVTLHVKPTLLDAVSGWVFSNKIDTLLVICETSEVPKYGKGNHPGWNSIIGSTTLKPALAEKGIRLIGPLDKNTTGKFPPGVGEVMETERDTAFPRVVGLSGGKVIFNIILPDTEAEILKKAGI